jgi:hydrogenase nickel incorporation protein HypB
MCQTCGCSDQAETRISNLQTGRVRSMDRDHDHDHDHDQDHHHGHGPRFVSLDGAGGARSVVLEAEVLAKNSALAARNRAWLEAREILALNLVSSPGAGKTSLLERTLGDLGSELDIHVIEGDQATLHDAERIRATGCNVVQINTGTGCHLEADMLAQALYELAPPPGSLLMIENVGNLVCPALFDLGERAKVVILSVTEGEDKPLKYPHMFRAASLLIVTKVDLLPHLSFDLERCLANARSVNPKLEILPLSTANGQGLDGWYAWLRARAQSARPTAAQLSR